MKSLALSIILIIFTCSISYSQCDTGSEPECQCETAEVLCSVSELDGYSSSMGSFLHPDDGPTPFCGPMSQTNNPTWFAFIAWCDNITLEVEFDNCTTVGGVSGAQLAVYEDCSFSNQVDCEDDCSGSGGSVSLDLTVTIGESYYVMLDGCLGSACEYEISVSPTDCDEFIEDWEEPVTEDEVVCLGTEVVYDVDNLSGATDWHWFIDGDEVEVTDEPSYAINWSIEGVYDLCVDASNICLEVDEDPSANCVTITVADPSAGEIDINSSPECPQEFINVFVDGFNPEVTYVQVLIITDMEGEVVQIINGVPDYDFTWPSCGMFTVYSLNFPEAEEIEVPGLGDDYYGSDCILFCCDEQITMVEFVDEEIPEFDRPPEDITVECLLALEDLDLDDIEELDVLDNCAEDQFVLGVETVMTDTCDGGAILREWTFADACGNTVMHTQRIEIAPWALPQFIDPPSDTMMTSLEYQTYVFPILNYTNGMTGDCQISGMILPEVEDNRSGCAGFVLLTYEFVDFCGRTVSASQRIDIISDVMVRDTTLNLCDDNGDGFEVINQADLDRLVALDLTGITVNYYGTQVDLQNMSNALVLPVNSQDLPETSIYAFVSDASGCDSEMLINISINDIPLLNLTSMDESCIGENDGVITVTQPVDISSYLLVSANDTILENNIDSLSPGNYSLILTDTLGCSAETSATINSGVDIQFQSLDYSCNGNDTGTDDTDDYYELEFVVTGGSGQYNFQLGAGSPITMYNYDELVQLEIPAQSQNVMLLASDIINGCELTFDMGTLFPCSSDCDITIENLEYFCNDNGTPLDGGDDVFDFEITTSVINGGASNMFVVYADGTEVLTANYGDVVNFTLPANGEQVIIRVEDMDNQGCFDESQTETLAQCSNLCAMEIELLSVTCVDPGTPSTNDDDLFDVVINVTGINSASTYTLEGETEKYNYGDDVILTGFLISDGDFDITVVDSDDEMCMTSVSVQAPPACSSPCELMNTMLNILDCNDNGTGMTAEDDFFEIEFSFQNILGGGAEYFLEDSEGNRFGPYRYDEVNTLGPWPANGEVLTLLLVDMTNATCSEVIGFSQLPCSQCTQTQSLNSEFLTLNCINDESLIEVESSGIIDSYMWEGPDGFSSNDATITAGIDGDYSVTVTYSDGCVLESFISIDANYNTPIADAGEDQLLNCVTSVVTVSASQSILGPDIQISWLDEDGNEVSQNPDFTATEPGTFELLLTNTVSGCVSEPDFVDVIQYLNEPLAVIYAEPTDILDCNIQSIELSHEEEPNTIYSWSVDNSILDDMQLTIDEAVVVELIALDTVSKCESETSIDITDFEVYPNIVFDEINILDCISGEACVVVSSNSINDLAFKWMDTQGNELSDDPFSYCFDAPGLYILELTDLENGCQNSESFRIEGAEIPEITMPEIVTLVNEEETELNPTFNISSNDIVEYIWTTSDGVLSCYNCASTMLTMAEDSTEVALTIITDEGCETRASTIVRIKRIPNVYVPNVFAPANSQRFTIFASEGIDRVDELLIYDRWGNMVFQNENFTPNISDEGWNGTKNDRDVEQGVYVYLVKYTLDGRPEFITGTITLLR